MHFSVRCRINSQVQSSFQAVTAETTTQELGPGMVTPTLCAESPQPGTAQLMTPLICAVSRAALTQVSRTLHSPVAMATDWEELSSSYCCQGRICQSKKVGSAGEGRSRAESPARLLCGRKIRGAVRVCFWLLAKHQGMGKEHFSAAHVQVSALKSPLSIPRPAVPSVLGAVMCWRCCNCSVNVGSGARDHSS